MKNARILSYKLSQKLTALEAECISAGTAVTSLCGQVSNDGNGWVVSVDVTRDI